MAHKKVQQKRLVVTIITLAKDPLELGEYTLDRLQEGFDKVIRETVPLAYHPGGDRYLEEWQDYTGVSVEEL